MSRFESPITTGFALLGLYYLVTVTGWWKNLIPFWDKVKNEPIAQRIENQIKSDFQSASRPEKSPSPTNTAPPKEDNKGIGLESRSKITAPFLSGEYQFKIRAK